MRTIAVVTTSRADYGIYKPILREISSNSNLKLSLIVSGMHLLPEFGETIFEIEQDSFPIYAKVRSILNSETSYGVVDSLAYGVRQFGELFKNFKPDFLLVLGDRFEMFSAVIAAVPYQIPIAHIGGGAVTEGAMDEGFRHSITKFSHLHFVETEEYGRRVSRMGEEPWRITVSGAPALDHLNSMQFYTLAEINKKFNVNIKEPFLLVTYHSVTKELDKIESQVSQLLSALDSVDHYLVFTGPNADPAGKYLAERYMAYVQENQDRSVFVNNFGIQCYYSLMRLSAAMVGNSSSGIIEAASFKLPVVNVGNRQAGRSKPANVIDVDDNSLGIAEGMRMALSIDLKKKLTEMENPYYQGGAARKIVEVLKTISIDKKLASKKFYDES